MRIAERIKQIRYESGLSIEDLAAKTGLAKSLIARLEHGRAVPTLTLEMLEDLADAAGVPVYRFFFDDVESVRTPKLTPRVTWKEILKGSELAVIPGPFVEQQSSVARVSRSASVSSRD
jgi:transcriptional regulator with XRE-family HTH domain